MFDKLKIDDPVGATAVHLVNGVFGTLAVGLFGVEGLSGLPHSGLFMGGGVTQLVSQVEGVVAAGAFTFAASWVVWYALKLAMGVRVSAEDEINGLDVTEIGMTAYPEPGEIEAKGREAAGVAGEMRVLPAE